MSTIREVCGFNKKVKTYVHRHTYCTNMLLSGSTLKETSVMIGHKTLRMPEQHGN